MLNYAMLSQVALQDEKAMKPRELCPEAPNTMSQKDP